jgi:hypothetical protein
VIIPHALLIIIGSIVLTAIFGLIALVVLTAINKAIDAIQRRIVRQMGFNKDLIAFRKAYERWEKEKGGIK